MLQMVVKEQTVLLLLKICMKLIERYILPNNDYIVAKRIQQLYKCLSAGYL